ncbi:MAG: RNA polymerase sigma factor FliA [Burkholderiaceae bacterium]|nr:RNA polymerase sigma factor FliA [Burkholderiaceae bacterium]
MPLSESRLPEFAPLVRRLALQMLARLPASVELDDLVQAGLIGLLDAMRRYEETADAQFETYATTRIRGAMLDELRSQDWLPRSVRSKAKKIEQTIGRLEQSLLRAPSEAEIATAMGSTLNEYQDLLNEAQGTQILHFEDFNAGNDDGQASDWLQAHTGVQSGHEPESGLLAADFKRALIDAIDALPERERLILSLCYEQGLNLKEIGAVLGVSEARVCQLRTQTTARIRAHLHTNAWDTLPSASTLSHAI